MVILVSSASCQNNYNYIQVTNSASAFMLNTPATLENVQVKSNAYRITVKSQYRNFYVLARVYSYTSSNGVVITSSVLFLDLNSVTPTQTTNFNPIPISQSDQVIAQGKPNGTSSIIYNFDLRFGPIGYDYPPGNYSCVILFTMVQP